MKEGSRWHSDRLGREITLVRWGEYGTPVLLFPTAAGDAEECERFLMIEALEPLLATGRIKVFSIDSLAGTAWLSDDQSPGHCAWLQNQFDACVYHEIVPAIRADCRTPDIGIVTAGASIGAFNAVASLCRHPDVFIAALGMSGTYDLSPWLHGEWYMDFYYSSPIHFLPHLEECEELAQLRRRFVLMATGGGRWEDPEQSWRMAHVLGAREIPNRVDAWGPEWDHDWITWRTMLPKYLSELA